MVELFDPAQEFSNRFDGPPEARDDASTYDGDVPEPETTTTLSSQSQQAASEIEADQIIDSSDAGSRSSHVSEGGSGADDDDLAYEIEVPEVPCMINPAPSLNSLS